MPPRNTRTQFDDQRRDHIDPKAPLQGNCPKQLQTYNLPTDDVEIREEIYYSLTSSRLFREEQKGCCKGSRGTGELLYIDQHILDENKTRRKNLAMAWIDYKKAHKRPTKLDNKLPQNVQNISWSYKLYRENHENLESGIKSRREKLSWSEDPKRYISKRCTITVTIYNCDDAA